jgi:hypothetical protein
MSKRKYIPCHLCGKKDGSRCRSGKGCTGKQDSISARVPDASTQRGSASGCSYRAAIRPQE